MEQIPVAAVIAFLILAWSAVVYLRRRHTIRWDSLMKTVAPLMLEAERRFENDDQKRNAVIEWAYDHSRTIPLLRSLSKTDISVAIEMIVSARKFLTEKESI